MDEQKKIKKRVEKIKQKIEQLSFELTDIREQCQHRFELRPLCSPNIVYEVA